MKGLGYTAGGAKLQAFADVDWGRDQTDRKSTSGIFLQIGTSAVSWKSSKQKMVALSTAEAEFMSASEVCKKVACLRHLLSELDQRQSSRTTMFEDNQKAIHWAEDGIRNAKHFAIRKHYVEDAIKDGTIEIMYCPSESMTPHLFTKPLMRTAFERHRDALCPFHIPMICNE